MFRLNIFDVVELNNKDKAVIKNIDSIGYYAEVLNNKDSTNKFRYIDNKEISNIIYKK